MKKIVFIALAMAMFAGNAKALEFEPAEGFTYMGLFGLNLSKLQNSGYGTKAGAMMGARVDYVLPKAHGTYVTAGLDWTMKGGKVSLGDLGLVFLSDLGERPIDGTAKYALHYFEVPIRVGFRYNPIEELGFYGEVGPYFAIGVGGKHKCSLDGDGFEVREFEDAYTYKAFKNNTDLERETFQRWDAGIGFRVGAEYNQHYNLMFGCDWGLTDMFRDNLRDAYWEVAEGRLPKVHNFNFSITFGYRF